MPSAPPRQNTAATNAQKYFRNAEKTDASVNQIRRTERHATAAKTAKLRELRLAKDEADKAAQEAENAGKVEPQTRRKRVAKAKPAHTIRMTY